MSRAPSACSKAACSAWDVVGVISGNILEKGRGGHACAAINMRFSFSLFVLVLVLCGPIVSATRVTNSLEYSNVKKNLLFYLTRFAVEKDHSMYTYGSLERTNPNDFITFHSRMILALLPQGLWDKMYSKSLERYNDDKCEEVITQILNDSILLVDDRCPGGDKDYLRLVPCDHENEIFKSCNQPSYIEAIDKSDFTYHVSSAPRTEYYYLFLMSCSINSNGSTICDWSPTDSIKINYDIHLVNDRPDQANLYTNEFPYNLQGTLTLYLVFVIFYIFLIVTHFLLHSRFCVRRRRYSMHVLVKIFSFSLVLESGYVLLELIHSSVYAANGVGAIALKYLGEISNQFSDWLLILVVILVGKGWQVTTSNLRWSKVTILIWVAYIFFSAVFFVWMVVSHCTCVEFVGKYLNQRKFSFFFFFFPHQVREQVYPLSLTLYHSYQSWAGGLYLAYRLFILVYILYEMRQVFLIEIRPTALKLYVVLAVCYLVWFLYLPLLTLLTLATNPVNRNLAMSSVYLVFDFFINLGMVLLFCPRWANKYFQFNNYINLLSRTPHTKSLKSYSGYITPTPV